MIRRCRPSCLTLASNRAVRLSATAIEGLRSIGSSLRPASASQSWDWRQQVSAMPVAERNDLVCTFAGYRLFLKHRSHRQQVCHQHRRYGAFVFGVTGIFCGTLSDEQKLILPVLHAVQLCWSDNFGWRNWLSGWDSSRGKLPAFDGIKEFVRFFHRAASSSRMSGFCVQFTSRNLQL